MKKSRIQPTISISQVLLIYKMSKTLNRFLALIQSTLCLFNQLYQTKSAIKAEQFSLSFRVFSPILQGLDFIFKEIPNSNDNKEQKFLVGSAKLGTTCKIQIKSIIRSQNVSYIEPIQLYQLYQNIKLNNFLQRINKLGPLCQKLIGMISQVRPLSMPVGSEQLFFEAQDFIEFIQSIQTRSFGVNLQRILVLLLFKQDQVLVSLRSKKRCYEVLVWSFSCKQPQLSNISSLTFVCRNYRDVTQFFKCSLVLLTSLLIRRISDSDLITKQCGAILNIWKGGY